MEHPGTFRNIPEHRIIMIIMRKICKINISKIKANRNKLLSARNMKIYFLSGGGVGESVLQLTAINAGSFPPIASRDLTTLCFSAQCSLEYNSCLLKLSSTVFALSARNSWHYDPPSAASY